ncbi:MAG: response regulator [Flavobacterium sp.]|nr:MAG: response regulator [Flavobacterium sp.] [Flavobacterium sp. FEMGT703F]
MKKINFIIIDDDYIFLRLGKMYLEKGNCTSTVTLYNDAKIALETIGSQLEKLEDTTVIFLDLNMPVVNGFDFLDEIQKKPNAFSDKLSIYIMSSSVNFNDIERVKNYKIVEKFLNKPINKEIVDSICN